MRIIYMSLLLLFSVSVCAMQRISTIGLRCSGQVTPRKTAGVAPTTVLISSAHKHSIQKRNFWDGFFFGWFLSDVMDDKGKKIKEQELKFSRELCELLHTYKRTPHDFEDIALKKMNEHTAIVIKDLQENVEQSEGAEKSEMENELAQRKQMLDEWTKK